MSTDSKKCRLRVYIPLAIVIIAVLTGCWYWYRDYKKYISTDDAHVDADNVSISSKILGRIIKLYADEGDTVHQGMILAELDSTDLLSQKNQSVTLKLQAVANQSQAEIRYSSDLKSIRVLEINLERATDDYARAKSQMTGGVITTEQFDHIRKASETATAQLDAAKAQLLVSKAQISSAIAAVESANAQVNVIETQLKNTKLYAPFDGIISKRWLLPGDVTQPGQSVFTLTKNKEIWIVAFLEETKISHVKTGQKVRFTIDAFPRIWFNGKVFLIGSNTAAMFSLIPPNNASGNFTKVTQRIPIRISIDSTESKKSVADYDLVPGMSAVVKIIK